LSRSKMLISKFIIIRRSNQIDRHTAPIGKTSSRIALDIDITFISGRFERRHNRGPSAEIPCLAETNMRAGVGEDVGSEGGTREDTIGGARQIVRQQTFRINSSLFSCIPRRSSTVAVSEDAARVKIQRAKSNHLAIRSREYRY
jgi:hypothetical protein